MTSQPREVEIFALGHQGDGETADGHYIPYTVPGDRVRATFDGIRGHLLEVVSPGPARVAAPCKHFGTCGGCAVQHLSEDFYRHWKVGQIRDALTQRNVTGYEMKPIVSVAPHSRRRATLSAKLTRDGMVVGFQERGSNFIVDIHECQVIDRRLEALIPKLREALAGELPRSAQCEIGLTATDTGIDMTLTLPGVEMDAPHRSRLAKLVAQLHVARLVVNGELVAQTSPPSLRWGGVHVAIPAGAFLQAVPAAEQAMQMLAVQGAANARKVADLFAGCGTFTFPLAKASAVTAFEGDADAADALKEAARHALAMKPIVVERRDLFRRPLLSTELEAFDSIVLNPPRAGAKAQCEQLAHAKVKRAVMVSCSPATFARDARTLIDGGFKLCEVTPIDQFLWATHVELVARFER
ncbi:MAG: methyltransferase [Alphaproteobacteria bacterium]|nr:methyltransferase [Alphaproteobacteria bacterium]